MTPEELRAEILDDADYFLNRMPGHILEPEKLRRKVKAQQLYWTRAGAEEVKKLNDILETIP
jgi:hypothetical protein